MTLSRRSLFASLVAAPFVALFGAKALESKPLTFKVDAKASSATKGSCIVRGIADGKPVSEVVEFELTGETEVVNLRTKFDRITALETFSDDPPPSLSVCFSAPGASDSYSR